MFLTPHVDAHDISWPEFSAQSLVHAQYAQPYLNPNSPGLQLRSPALMQRLYVMPDWCRTLNPSHKHWWIRLQMCCFSKVRQLPAWYHVKDRLLLRDPCWPLDRLNGLKASSEHGPATKARMLDEAMARLGDITPCVGIRVQEKSRNSSLCTLSRNQTDYTSSHVIVCMQHPQDQVFLLSDLLV